MNNELLNKIHHCNTFHSIKNIQNESVRLIITSPPYNIGKSYENKVSLQIYLDSYVNLIKELFRILAYNGSLCWQVGNYVNDGEVFPLDIFFYKVFKECGFKLRNRIIWHFEHGLHCKKRLSGRYETILWFTKNDSYIFNLDDIRIPAKYPGKKYFKGEKKGKYSCNPLGKNPSDLWMVVKEDWENLVWEIPNVKANHPEKTDHPCQFPIELVERCILMLTNEEDLVFDPFAGVGTTLISALRCNRNAICFEKELDYVKIAGERLVKYLNNSLNIRPLGKSVHQPKITDKIAQVPEEWKLSNKEVYL